MELRPTHPRAVARRTPASLARVPGRQRARPPARSAGEQGRRRHVPLAAFLKDSACRDPSWRQALLAGGQHSPGKVGRGPRRGTRRGIRWGFPGDSLPFRGTRSETVGILLGFRGDSPETTPCFYNIKKE